MTANCSARPNSGHFPFLSLTPELRNQVYDLLLRINGPVQPMPKVPTSAINSIKCKEHGTYPDSALSLLAVNRQIHDEAAGIFYHVNTLVFQYTIHLHGFIITLGGQRLAAIREVIVHYQDLQSGGMSMTDMTFTMLRRLTVLRKLHVIMHGEFCNKVTNVNW
jgi:hypothetical protein